MNTAIIHQPFGLGDCIFSQGIAHKLMRDGYVVYWPVKQMYLQDLRLAYPEIHWLPENLKGIPRNAAFGMQVPIRWADTILGLPYKDCMRAKYDIMQISWLDWSADAMFVRYPTQEQTLFALHNLQPSEPYNLISHHYTGDFKFCDIPLPKNNLRNIYINHISGYSLFDWAALMEHATEIHFVASSNIYLLELLELQAERICIYPRKPDQPHHKFYDYILRRHNYTLMP